MTDPPLATSEERAIAYRLVLAWLLRDDVMAAAALDQAEFVPGLSKSARVVGVLAMELGERLLEQHGDREGVIAAVQKVVAEHSL